MAKRRLLELVVILSAVCIAACGRGQPGVDGLRESFAQQLAANRVVTDFHKSGEDLLFSGPGLMGGTAKWRVHIDSAVIEATNDAKQPYKGTVKSSWYADDQIVKQGGKDSNLPFGLDANGLAQDCWALWDNTTKKWGWD